MLSQSESESEAIMEKTKNTTYCFWFRFWQTVFCDYTVGVKRFSGWSMPGNQAT